jgi:hypothetical protein
VGEPLKRNVMRSSNLESKTRHNDSSILCGLGIGWLAFENLMWAVWGKQNRWFEYVGFWGCPIMLIAGFVALKNLRLGTLLGSVGFSHAVLPRPSGRKYAP